ncbi:unnamed protein product [Caenorhabditis sp. 36 PRJEB53466]|nr:unnamed protein product [Caenorhabditis sp. 36 PRJEB53466]
MSSIHYKFRAELDYKTLQFDGLHIRGEQLVREICSKENLKLELFELQLQNAHTKKMYSDEELIPRNSSIIVQRFPRKDAAKVQKVQAGVNSGMVTHAEGASSSLDPVNQLSQAEFDGLDEAERLNLIRDQSTRAFDPSNFRRRPQGGIMTGPPPPTYTCNRCYQPGHWYKNCPMLNTKRTTGIPSQELMETTADDPAAMLHPSGKYVVPIMHWKARQETLQRKQNLDEGGSASPAQAERKVPPELLCPICHSLFKEAVVTSCCGSSYCAECIQDRIMDPDSRKCPGNDCGNTEISIESLIPNKTLREGAAAWITSSAPGAQLVPSAAEPEQIRIRIGLKAPASAPNLSGISPGTSLVPQQPPNVLQPVHSAVLQQPVQQQVALPPSHTIQPAIPGFPATSQPAVSSSIGLQMMQDVSLPPPGIPGLSAYGQTLPGIPGLMPAYGIPVFPASGFPPAVSSVPLASSASSGFDEWNAFLRNKDKYDKRRDARDREREKDRTRRKERRDSRGRRRRDSSTSSSASSSSSSGEEERRRREKRREKEKKSRRSVEKERSSTRRSDDRRDHRERETYRESSSRRAKESTKLAASSASSSSRRDGGAERREEARRRDQRKKEDDRKKDRTREPEPEELEDDIQESKHKDVESKDEDEIDGIIAEYGNVQVKEEEDAGEGETTEKVEKGEEEVKRVDVETKKEEETLVEMKDAAEESQEPTADEEPIETEPSAPRAPASQTLETSEAEVAETRTEPEEDQEEEEEETETDRKEDEASGNDEKMAESSGGEEDRKKKHKKSKKAKKNKKKGEEDEVEMEEEEKHKKKHKKHKKEKKAKKERMREELDAAEEADERKDRGRREEERKRKRDSRERDYDSDSAPKPKSRRSDDHQRKDGEKEREKDRKTYREEKEREERKKRDEEREKDRRRRERPEKPARVDKSAEKSNKKQPEVKTRRSVHERLQKADDVVKSASTLTRKPVSFTVNASKSARVRRVSSSSSTKEQEEEERSKHRRKKEETDVESSAEKEKAKKSSSRSSAAAAAVSSSSSSGELSSSSKHKNIKIKFDL